MLRLETPLRYRTLWATGDVALWAELDLLLQAQNGVWKPVIFRVDSGTEMTTMSVANAQKLGLPVPKQRVLGLRLAGQEFRAGVIRARVVGLDATEYVFPCYFLGDPHNPAPGPSTNLLGLSGVIDKIRLSFDGTRSVGALYGHLLIEQQ
jgi:hypothetical protein